MYVNMSGKKSEREILEELVAFKKNLKAKDTERILSEKGFAESTEKLFKPIIEKQGTQIEKGFKGISQGLKAIEDKQVSLFNEPIEYENLESDSVNVFDPVLASILERVESDMKLRDLAKGIHFNKDGEITLGSKPVVIDRANDIIWLGSPENYYKLTDGLLNLLMTTDGDDKKYTDLEQENYVDMLFKAGLLHKKDGTRHGWKGDKYKNIVQPLVSNYPERIKPKHGSGLRQKKGKMIDVIVGTSEELLDQLKLALASIQAGNTSNLLKNKVIAILDNLFSNKKINKSTYIEALKYVD